MSKDDFVFDGFESANTTAVPDVLFDVLLAKLSGAELKVLLYIIRRTRGFKKDTDAISLTQFEKGITTRDGKVLDRGCDLNRETICKALQSLEAMGCIKSQKRSNAHNEKDVTLYSIHFKTHHMPEKNPTTLVGKSDHTPVGFSDYPSRIFPLEVVGKSDIQETVVQQTVVQDTYTDTSAQPEPIATSHEVAAHTLFSQEADEQASLIAEAKSEGLQEISEQEEKPPSKSSSSQGKRRPPAKPVDETLKVRVERVYGYFDALAQETSGDATYRYQRTKKATAAITEWLKGSPTEELLREVYLELWNTPADIRSGFDWKRNMHIHSVLAQYDSRSLAIKAKRHAAQPKPATVAPRPARHVDDDEEPLQYRTPQSQRRNNNNRPFQAIAAARRA